MSPSKLPTGMHAGPSVDNTLFRPRLLRQLNQDSHRCVCLFGAPGVGKSTLAAQFQQQFEGESIWVNVEPDKDSVSRCAMHLSMRTAEHLPNEPAGDDSAVIERFYAQCEKPFCLVIDDAHHLTASERGYRFIEALIAQLPGHGRLILTSRDLIAGPIAKFVVKQQLICLDTQALLFDAQEMSTLFDLLNIPEGEVARQIVHQTQGWVAGVVIFSRSLDDVGKASEPLSRYGEKTLYDFLLHEVFEPLTAKQKFILLRLVALPLFNVGMLQDLMLLDRDLLIESLDRIRLSTGCLYASKAGFSKSDDVWYQMNPVFKRFLMRHGRETLTNREYFNIVYQSGRVLEAAGATRWAAENYCQASSWQQLISLCMREGKVLLEAGEHEVLLEWVEAIPQSVRDQLPWLLVLYGRALSVMSLPDASKEWQKASIQFEREGDFAGLYMTWAGTALNFALGRADLSGIDEHFDKLHRLRRRCPQYPSQEVHITVIIGVMWCLNWRCPENFEYGTLAEECEVLLSEEEDPTARLRLIAVLLWHFYNYGFVPLTRDVDTLLDQIPSLDTVEPQTALFFLLIKSMYLAARAQVSEANRTTDEAEQLHLYEGLPARTNLLSGRMTTFLLNDQPENVGEEAQQLRTHPEARTIEKINARISEAWLCVQRGNFATAQPILNNVLKKARSMSHSFGVSTCYFLLSVVNFRLGQYEASLSALDELKVMRLSHISRLVQYKVLLLEAWIVIQGAKQDAYQAVAKAIYFARDNDIVNFHGSVGLLLSDVYSQALDLDIAPDFVCQRIVLQKVSPNDLGRTLINWPWSVRIRSLGEFSVTLDGQNLDLAKQSGRPIQMLKLLVTRGREPILISELIEILWPELDGEKGFNNFKVTLSRLRKLVGRDAVIQQDNRVSLSRQHCWVDAWVVQGEVKRLLHRQSWLSAKSSRLQRLIDVYRGPFLNADSDFWVLRYRESLHKDYLTLVKRLSNHYLLIGYIDDAIELARRGLSVDETYEPLYVVLMNCFSSLKQKSSIMNAFEQYKEMLRIRFGLEPSPQVQAAYQQSLRNAISL
ncbi:hypothetical protein NBRC116494_03400 [Aurantivibrio plasticivorans]